MAKRYNILTITISDLKELIANGDDRHDNQIRVTKDGQVFLSQDIVGADNIENIAFRFESFDAGNDYVGQQASEDDEFINGLYNALKQNWNDNCPRTYIDCW